MKKFLNTKRKRVLLLVETSRNAGRQIIEGITRYTIEKNTWNIFFSDRGLREQVPSWIKHWRGDGIIARTCDEKSHKILDDLDIPIVELVSWKYNMVDNHLFGNMIADHFLELGLQHFAFFSMGQSWWSKGLCRFFDSALQQKGHNCLVFPQTKRKDSQALPVLWWEGCDQQVVEWLESLPKPIGIFCPMDTHAIYLINVCNDAEIAVPEDVAIMGMENDTQLCEAVFPTLTSIDLNQSLCGYNAAMLLDKIMNGDSLPPLPLVTKPSHIAKRQSTNMVAIANPIVAKSLNFIHSHVADNIRVSDVAQQLDISRRTLTELFRKHLRRSPEKVILKSRMDWSKKLLRETNYSLTEIAELVGYQSLAYFCRAFLRETGQTPTEFRKEVSFPH